MIRAGFLDAEARGDLIELARDGTAGHRLARMIEVPTVNAQSTIMLFIAIMAMYPAKRLIHVFLDNAKYRHAQMVQDWLARPECRIGLHYA